MNKSKIKYISIFAAIAAIGGAAAGIFTHKKRHGKLGTPVVRSISEVFEYSSTQDKEETFSDIKESTESNIEEKINTDPDEDEYKEEKENDLL